MKAIFCIRCLTCFLAAVLLGVTPVLSKEEGCVVLDVDGGQLQLIPLNQNAIRVRFVQAGSRPMEELIYTEKVTLPAYRFIDGKQSKRLVLKDISVEFNVPDRTLTFRDKQGKVILQEMKNGRLMQRSMLQDEPTYLVEQHFASPADEYLYGTGQFQDGYLNIKGLSRRLTQVNTQISIPFILSSKGYGLLWNNYGRTDFNPSDHELVLIPSDADGEIIEVDATSTKGNVREKRQVHSFVGTLSVPQDGKYSLLLDVGQSMARKYYLSVDGKNILDFNNLWLPPTTSLLLDLKAGEHSIEVQGDKNDKPVLYWQMVKDETVFRSPVAEALDYTVFAGKGDDVIASYRSLTGTAPLMPLWSMGYIHCRERYNTQAELLENAREFRSRKLPMDMIVQDWQYWGKHGWNAMRFDEERYPDPQAMVDELHQMNARLMLSVWSKVDAHSEVGKLAAQRGFYIPGTEWIDFFNPEAAVFYWSHFRDGLLKYGIDAWWQDATEPENDDLHHRRINQGKEWGDRYRNVFPLYVSRTVYNGLRQDDPDRRAMIFTRSGFSGMQRYAAATWSGDVGHDWETLRRQITGGLGQMAAGIPWWTYDAGGFFRPSDQYTDARYHEQLVRWVQTSTFLPLMRVHGYMSQTEPWRYGEEVEQIIRSYLDLRYRLIPYIYTQNAAISFQGSTLMRPLVMDFPQDERALEQKYAYLFGPSILVSPVVDEWVKSVDVYLPEYKSGWVDFWTGKHYEGGQAIEVSVELDRIPLFVRGASILPLGPVKQYTSESKDEPWEIRIYPGADAVFTVYEDEGNNYNYEKGESSWFTLKWNDRTHTFSISEREGSFKGMEPQIEMNVVVVSTDSGHGIYPSETRHLLTYTGKSLKVKLQ